MFNRIKKWWGERSTNEKLMYGLIVVLVIGIATRARYVFTEIVDSFSNIFS